MKRRLLAVLLALAPAVASAQANPPATATTQATQSTSAIPATPEAEANAPPETSAVIVTPAKATIEATVEAGVDPAVDATIAAPTNTIEHSTTADETAGESTAIDSTGNTGNEGQAANAGVMPESTEATSDGKMRGADVFQRLAARLSQPSCPEGDAGLRWRKRYASHPASFAGHLAEILPLLEFVTGEIERSGLPAEFAFIPLVESWYRPDAIGIGGPAGMWQMIASTARNHGIHIQPGYDGRLSPVESTRAALSYLKVLHGMFGGDWQAAVMAYNAGEYRLLKALKVQGNRSVSAPGRRPHGLSAITYDYVLKLQALACLVSEPGRSGLTLPGGTTFMPLAPVLVAAETRSLEELARQQGISAALLRKLNPGYRGGKIPAGVPRMVLMPGVAMGLAVAPEASAATTAVVQANNDADDGSDASAVKNGANGQHQVQDGETLWQIAKRYGLSLQQLRKINHLGRGSLIRIGQKLRVQP